MRKIKNINKLENDKVIRENYSILNLVKIVVLITIIFAVFYFITTLVVNNSEPKVNLDSVVIDNKKMILSNMLSKSEKEYFVLATFSSNNMAYQQADYTKIYNKYISDYEEKYNFYYVDMSDALNKNYVGNKTIILSSLDDIKLSEDVLFEVKNNKIVNSYIGNKNIISKLSNLK